MRGGEERRRPAAPNHLDDYDLPRTRGAAGLVNGDAGGGGGGGGGDASRGRKMGTAGREEVRAHI